MRHMVETTVIEENNVRQYILDEKLETFSACLAEYLDIGGDSHLSMMIRHSKCESHVWETLMTTVMEENMRIGEHHILRTLI